MATKMKKYLIVIVFILGCHEAKVYHPELRVKDTATLALSDGIYLNTLIPIEPLDSLRYFFFNYETTLKDNSSKEYGEVWFSLNHFPSKKEIEKYAATLLTFKRSCYQNIIVTYMYEFKDKTDFNSFSIGYKRDKIKQKPTCGTPQNLDTLLISEPISK